MEFRNIEIWFSYQDADSDGFVDGIKVKVKDLSVWRLRDGEWRELPVAHFPESSTVLCKTDELSVFALGGPPSLFTLSDMVVYPNPARVHEGEKAVFFSNLPSGSKIEIYNITGELITTLFEEGGVALWSLERGQVAAGVYIYLASNLTEKMCGKIGHHKIRAISMYLQDKHRLLPRI